MMMRKTNFHFQQQALELVALKSELRHLLVRFKAFKARQVCLKYLAPARDVTGYLLSFSKLASVMNGLRIVSSR